MIECTLEISSVQDAWFLAGKARSVFHSSSYPRKKIPPISSRLFWPIFSHYFFGSQPPSRTISSSSDLLPHLKIMPHAASAAPINVDRPASATGAAPATAAVPAADSVGSDHRARSQRWSGAVKNRAVRRFVNKRRGQRSVRDPATDPAAVSHPFGADVSSLGTIAAHSSAAVEVDVNAPAQADLFDTAESMLSDDATIEEYVALCSRLVWPGIQSLRPEQTERRNFRGMH